MVNARLAGGTGGDDVGNVDTISDAAAAKIADAVLNRSTPYVDPSTGKQSTTKSSSLALITTWIENTIINNPRLRKVEDDVAALPSKIPPCHVEIDVNTLADQIVSSMGADLASKVIDALGERINAAGGGSA
jgi:hypothetical protein